MISAIYIIYLAEKQESNEFSQIELLVNRRYHQTLPHDEIILQNFHNLMTNLPSSEQVPCYIMTIYPTFICDVQMALYH